jgi:hypothetical protein
MNKTELMRRIFQEAVEMSTHQQIDLVYYLLETTDLTMREIGQLVGRSESGVYRINIGTRQPQPNRTYPVRESRYRGSNYFHPAAVLEKIQELKEVK